MRSLEYDAQQHALLVLDQTRLPHETVFVTCRTATDVGHAIRAMQVRGAPAIGVAAAYGMALAARADATLVNLDRTAEFLRATRPTAVNLRWAVERSLRVVHAHPEDVAAAL